MPRKDTDAPCPSGQRPSGQAPPLGLISALRRHDGKFAPREQKVADVIKANLETVPEMTIANLAAAAGVSTPTVIRFCRTLGCNGFRDFKLRLARSLASGPQHRHPGTPLDRALGAACASIAAAEAQIAPDDITAAARRLARCRHLVTADLGVGSSMLASEAAHRFTRLGIPGMAATDSYQLLIRAATLGPGDALLLFSSNGQIDAAVVAARVARGHGADTICIARAGAPLTRACDLAIGLDLPEVSDAFGPSASRFACLAVLDALALSVAEETPERSREAEARIRAALTAWQGGSGPQFPGD